ncbi:MAG: PAC2 family protein [Actinomycetota bacterium]|jgi:proteasome assembly chaperone (PAC2) family protein|nr:PAC2 family protein [Actinomycetota bacterium]
MTEFDGLPTLRSPVVVAAFEGWNDAGDAATSVIEHLELAWQAKPLAVIDPDDYYDFQVNRPSVSLVDGLTRRIEWPTSRLSTCSPPKADRDVVLLRGLEPNMRWRSFCDEILGLCHDVEVDTVVLLGALLSDNPHTRPVPVSGSASDLKTARRLSLQTSRYEGPTGIVGVMQDAATRAGLAAVSLWAQVPHYVSQPPCPKASLALLRRLEDVLDFPVPLGELPQEALAWQETVDQLAGEDEEMAEYVRQLEQREPETELREASGEAIAREFERYLRRHDGGR